MDAGALVGAPAWEQDVLFVMAGKQAPHRARWDIARNRIVAAQGAEDVGAESGGQAEDTAEEAAAAFLWEHQSGARVEWGAECASRPALVYMHDRAYWGFAANVHFMTVALNYALAFNRTFLARDADHWNYGGTDCRHVRHPCSRMRHPCHRMRHRCCNLRPLC